MKLKELAKVLTDRKTYLFRDRNQRFIMSCSRPYLVVTPLRECDVLEIDGTEIILEVEEVMGL